MLRIAVLVSGGGTNLQAIIDAVKQRKLTAVEIALVISNKPDVFALERAKTCEIPAICINPKEYADKEAYERAMLDALSKADAELIVLAGFLVVLSPGFVKAYEGRIINIHPSLIPSFCGDGY
ncbi:MAG TPA: formyltransferase family protein, partial [Lachnospiraceae bacterium]|nr:formyltransferase family protein [Lachnospiraceae bacterium]